jgi:Xaa-Pro aminopeptidase
MRAGMDQVAEGVLEVEVAAAAEYAIRRAGAELSFATVMGAGPRTADATFFPRRRPMATGEYVILDCGARVEGYHGDMCRTVVVGPPSGEQRRVLEAVEACVHAACEAARPGATVRDVHEAARRSVTDAGFGEHWWGYYMPHGAGTGQHELPAGLDDGDLVLVPGMVMCIEPGIAIPGVGGVILEQIVAIGETGAETLNALPLNLWDG